MLRKIIVLLILSFAWCGTNRVLAQDACESASNSAPVIAVAAVQPAYPPKAVAAKADGDVLVDAKIDANGKVIETVFVSGNELLKESVLTAAKKWKFNQADKSANKRGARLTFTFYLNYDKYEEPGKDDAKYKYRVKIYFSAEADCFNKCGNTKEND